MKIVPIILLGGAGTRLWPVSREKYPKQFLKLIGEKSLLQETLLRLEGIEDLLPSIVICNESHRFVVAQQMAELDYDLNDIILEPVGRNTAPAITVGALRALQKHGDVLLLILPADHVIKNTARFQRAVEVASSLSEKKKLVTFGVKPNKPETGYGYLRFDAPENRSLNGITSFNVKEFVEKPNKETAGQYLQSGHYYWNSGMFLFKASFYLHELELVQAEIIRRCKKALDNCEHDLDFIRLDRESFSENPNTSIDYALMEKSKNVVMVPLDAHWSDIGSWDALWELKEKEKNNNVIDGDVLIHDSYNCLVRAENKLVSLVGVDNLVVIDTKDVILVAEKDKVQDVKIIVERLRREGRKEAKYHQEVFRPWGKYDCIDCGDRFQVKRITIKPGEGTSLQQHKHRAEHWIIVRGVAEITRDDDTFLCSENQSIYIPQGVAHSISNPGKIPMEMIEVQTGSYLGEDDIVRLKDRYKRTNL